MYVKLNSLDTQVKTCMTKQDNMSDSLDKILDIVSRLYEKVEDIEKPSEVMTDGNEMIIIQDLPNHKGAQIYSRSSNDTINMSVSSEKSEEVTQRNSTTENETQHTNTDRTELIGQNNGSENTQMPLNNHSHEELQQNGSIITCDNLIISDSMLRRINPRKFSPRQITVKKFVSGGITAGTNFITQQGVHYKPKKVLIHIGTRDLPHNTLTEELYNRMVETAVKTWDTAEIYILPILERKDLTQNIVNEANHVIKVVCDRHNVTLMNHFKVEPNMYYDQVHLNDRIGLPRLIQHIKIGMNLARYSYRSKVQNQPVENSHERGQAGQPSSTYADSTFASSYNTIIRPSEAPARDIYSTANIQNTPMTPWSYTGIPNVPIVPPTLNQNIPWMYQWPVRNMHIPNQLHVSQQLAV